MGDLEPSGAISTAAMVAAGPPANEKSSHGNGLLNS